MKLTRFPALAAAVLALSPRIHHVTIDLSAGGRCCGVTPRTENGDAFYPGDEVTDALNALATAEAEAAYERGELYSRVVPLEVRLAKACVYEAEVVGSVRLALDLFHSQDNAKAFVSEVLKTRQPDAAEEAWKTQTDGILKTGRGRLRGYVTTRTLLD
jgi:hypothetical protein